ncbi:MAG: hypothetical protein FWC16_04480 [Defluviitaleaceae bacterium]|nr:hypothetical protein [Defluviitaleaceae bacterium]MCL2274164.1 hypothetical protein [Defluviitaleaceae bacterium]
MSKYYVQHIAGNYLRNVAKDMPLINVHDRFLHGTSREEFTEGYHALLSLMRQLYADIAQTPADFGMLLKEITDVYEKNVEYTNSNASLLRVPNLLYLLSTNAALDTNGALVVDGGVVSAEAKAFKITGMPALLAKLRDYAFDINDFGKAPTTGELLTITYADNRYLTTALKSMADALNELTLGDRRNPQNEWFYMMNPRLIENEQVKEPTPTFDNFLTALDTMQGECAAALHPILADNTKVIISKASLMRNEWICDYKLKQNKKMLAKLKSTQDILSVKLNLHNINQYMHKVKAMPEKIQHAIRTHGFECGGCNPKCSGGFAFEMNGANYNKCHCGSFVFTDVKTEDIAYFKQLISLELTI